MNRRSVLVAAGSAFAAVSGCLSETSASDPTDTGDGTSNGPTDDEDDTGDSPTNAGDDNTSDGIDDPSDETGNGETTANGGERGDSEIEVRKLNEGGVSPSLGTFEREWDLEGAEEATASTDLRVGSSDDSHRVTVMAESETPVETALELRTGDGRLLYEETVQLSAARYAAVRFEEPESYLIDFATETGSRTVEVRESSIDCNASTQSVLLRDDGGVDEHHVSTLVLCDIDLNDLEERTLTEEVDRWNETE